MRVAWLVLVGACLLCYGTTSVASTSTTTVFDDALAAPFQDWSWATVSWQYTAVVHGGTKAISFTPNSYGAVYIHADGSYICTTTFSTLLFWIYRPTGSSTSFNFNLIVGSNPTGPTLSPLTLLGGNWPVNTWVQVSISLSQFPAGCYDGFWLQDGSGLTNNPPVFLDDICFVNGTTSTSTTPAATTTPAASTTKSPTTTQAAGTTTKSPVTTSTTKSPVTTTTTKAPSTTTTTKAASTTTTSPSTTTAPTGAVDAQVLALYNTATSGQATYYGQYTNGGECMLDPTPDSGLKTQFTVAIANYMSSKTCGMCLKVTGLGTGSGAAASLPNKTSIVYVNNECPGCPTGNLDFGLNGDGAWDIQYQAVPCPITSKIQYVFKDGSSVSWMGIQPRNTVYPVYKFAVKVGGAWTDVPRTSYNYFVNSFSGVTFPITIQMTAVNGQVITDVITSIVSGVIQGNVQFTP